MSIDIYGRHPDARAAEHRAYHPVDWTALVGCICDITAPFETMSACKDWLYERCCSAEGSVALADQLDSLIEEGAVERYVAGRNAFLIQHPLVACFHCKGSGTLVGEGRCVHCDGSGTTDRDASYKDLYVSDVREFAEFLRHSGGISVR